MLRLVSLLCSSTQFNSTADKTFLRHVQFTCVQWLKYKIRSGGTLHSGLGTWKWSCAFP